MRQQQLPGTRPAGWGVPLGVGAGAGIGLIFGILLDQLALGMVMGAAIGLVVGAMATSASTVPRERRAAVTAAAIGLVTAGLVAILWIVMD